MINENKTLELFGYTSDSLSHGSNKKIVAICDGCNKERILIFQYYRDLCISCASKNKKYSEEYRRKMSESNSSKNNPMYGVRKFGKDNPMYGVHRYGKDNPFYGKKHSEETKQKMRETALNMSDETKQKISKTQTGKFPTEETKQKMRKSRSNRYGEKSPNWQGGISFEPYCINFNNKIKEQIREEFNRKCFLCGVSENNCNRKLSVHHVDYDRTQGCNSDWKLIPVCLSCHSKTSGKYIRDYYEELISRLLYIRELIFEYNNKIDFRSI